MCGHNVSRGTLISAGFLGGQRSQLAAKKGGKTLPLKRIAYKSSSCLIMKYVSYELTHLEPFNKRYILGHINGYLYPVK